MSTEVGLDHDPKYLPIIDALLKARANSTTQQPVDILSIFKKVKNGENSAELCAEIKRAAHLPGDILNTRENSITNYTLLMCASYKGSLQVVQELLESKADVDLQDEDGKTALFWATRANDPKYLPIINALLNAGANPNIPSNTGTQPFHQAVANSYIEVVQRVIELTAKDKLESVLQGKNARGKTVFDLAEEPAIIALLLSHVTNIPNPEGLLNKLRGCDQTNSDVFTSINILLNKARSPVFITPENKSLYELHLKKLQEISDTLHQIEGLPLLPVLLDIVVQYDVPRERYSPRMFSNDDPARFMDTSADEYPFSYPSMSH